ncbi:MAG TPA: ribonuclease P protein component [Gemmatimonadales bacterium]
MLPRGHRLTRGGDLQAVRQKGKRFRTGLIEVRAVASPLCRSRVGLVVPRYRQTAVARNRVKRRLRELARLRLLPALAARSPVDVVIRAAPSAYGASFVELGAELERVIRQLERAVLPEAPVREAPTPRRGSGGADVRPANVPSTGVPPAADGPEPDQGTGGVEREG